MKTKTVLTRLVDDEMAVSAAERMLAYFDEIRRLHEATHGERLEAYKDTDARCLVEAFKELMKSERRGLAFAAEFVHTLTWAQCLENGNHRTTILFLSSLLDHVGVGWPVLSKTEDEAAFTQAVDGWATRSKALLEQRGKPTSSQARLGPDHAAAALRWVERELATQSKALAMLGPTRLISFLSRSES